MYTNSQTFTLVNNLFVLVAEKTSHDEEYGTIVSVWKMFKIESYVTPILLSYVDKYVRDFKPADAQVS